MVYKHKKDNNVKIGLKISDIIEKEIELISWWEEDDLRKLPRLYKLDFFAEYFEIFITKKRKYTLNYKYLLDKGITPQSTFLDFMGTVITDLSMLNGEIPAEIDDKIVKPDQFKVSLNKLRKIKKNVTFTFEKINDLKLFSVIKGDFLLVVNVMLLTELCKRIDEKINFISSFRLYPERTYYEKTQVDLKVGKFGEDYVNQLILWETQKAREYKELIKIMRDLSLFDSISSKRLDGGRFELMVKVNKKSVPTSLNDVGFGISQFLPIVVADLQLGEESTLFVAQPEIHLHPSVQAEFGNYMVNQIDEHKKNYIIETHSEYLLNRIRLAIVKGEIPKDDVKVYYLQNDGEETTTHRLEFTTDGRILNAPEDFFKTYQMDVMNIAVSANGE
jgi:hypothetical protein